MAKIDLSDPRLSPSYVRAVKHSRRVEKFKMILVLTICGLLSKGYAEKKFNEIKLLNAANKTEIEVSSEDEIIEDNSSIIQAINETQDNLIISEIEESEPIMVETVQDDTESLRSDYEDYLNWVNRFKEQDTLEIRQIPMELESRILPTDENSYDLLLNKQKGSFFVNNKIKTRDINFDSLKETINDDIIGYIEIPGLIEEKNVKDYLVVQNDDYLTTTDVKKQDRNYYLNYNIYNENKGGSVFQDSRNNSLGNDFENIADVNLVFCHWKSSGRGFSNIEKISKTGYSEKHPEILENPPYGIFYSASGELYLMKLISVNVVDGASDLGIYTEDFNTLEEYQQYLHHFIETSDYYIKENVSYDKPMKIMVTGVCSYEKRYPLVNGKSNDRTLVLWALYPQRKYIPEIEKNNEKTLSK